MPGPNSPYTKLDASQVIQQVFDEANDKLRVDASVTAEIGDVVLDADTSDIAIQDRATGNQLAINADGSIDVNITISASTDSIKIGDGTDNADVTSAGALRVDALANDRMKVVEAPDVSAAYTWADFGTSNERITSIVYTAASVSGVTVTKTLNYTLDGSAYRLTTVTWAVS